MPNFTEIFDIHFEARDVTVTVEIDSTLRRAEDPGHGAHRVGAEGEITHIQVNKVETGDGYTWRRPELPVFESFWVGVVQEYLIEQEYIRDLIGRKL